MSCIAGLSRKRKISDTFLWQKPLHPQKIPKINVTTQKTQQKNFDNITIADRLRMVSVRNSNHPTGVVKPNQGLHLLQIYDVPVGYNSHKQLRRRPFDIFFWGGGVGCWHFLEINILTLKMLEINNLSRKNLLAPPPPQDQMVVPLRDKWYSRCLPICLTVYPSICLTIYFSFRLFTPCPSYNFLMLHCIGILIFHHYTVVQPCL